MFDFMRSEESSKRKKILIVDDDACIVETLRDRLEMNGYVVVTAHDGLEGLEKAGKEMPDIILVDVAMPVMGGYEMLEDLRKIDECKMSPVVMITGEDDRRTIAKIIACGGMDDYIAKPFDFDSLLKKIERVFEYNHAAPMA